MKKLIITGNVGADPELRIDSSGNQFSTFSVAVSVGTKQTPKTDWVNILANNKFAEIAMTYIKKGHKVLIEGFPTTTAYTNTANQAKSSLNLYVHHLEILSKMKEVTIPCSKEHNDYENGAEILPDTDINAEIDRFLEKNDNIIGENA